MVQDETTKFQKHSRNCFKVYVKVQHIREKFCFAYERLSNCRSPSVTHHHRRMFYNQDPQRLACTSLLPNLRIVAWRVRFCSPILCVGFHSSLLLIWCGSRKLKEKNSPESLENYHDHRVINGHSRRYETLGRTII